MSEIAHLDICCFKRPFDDTTIDRIRREAEATRHGEQLRVEVVMPDQIPLEAGGDQV